MTEKAVIRTSKKTDDVYREIEDQTEESYIEGALDILGKELPPDEKKEVEEKFRNRPRYLRSKGG